MLDDICPAQVGFLAKGVVSKFKNGSSVETTEALTDSSTFCGKVMESGGLSIGIKAAHSEAHQPSTTVLI